MDQRRRRRRRVVEEVRHSSRLYRSPREWSRQEYIVTASLRRFRKEVLRTPQQLAVRGSDLMIQRRRRRRRVVGEVRHLNQLYRSSRYWNHHETTAGVRVRWTINAVWWNVSIIRSRTARNSNPKMETLFCIYRERHSRNFVGVYWIYCLDRYSIGSATSPLGTRD